jgi:hypothetical protein
MKDVGRITQIIQSGLGSDPRKLSYYRQVMIDPRAGFFNLSYRDYALEIYNNLLNYMLNDVQLYTRLRQLLIQKNRKMSMKAHEELERMSAESGVDFDTLMLVYFDGADQPHSKLNEEQMGLGAANAYILLRKTDEEDRNPTIRQIKKLGRGQVT